MIGAAPGKSHAQTDRQESGEDHDHSHIHIAHSRILPAVGDDFNAVHTAASSADGCVLLPAELTAAAT